MLTSMNRIRYTWDSLDYYVQICSQLDRTKAINGVETQTKLNMFSILEPTKFLWALIGAYIPKFLQTSNFLWPDIEYMNFREFHFHHDIKCSIFLTTFHRFPLPSVEHNLRLVWVYFQSTASGSSSQFI